MMCSIIEVFPRTWENTSDMLARSLSKFSIWAPNCHSSMCNLSHTIVLSTHKNSPLLKQCVS